jgi:hypothetical protein
MKFWTFEGKRLSHFRGFIIIYVRDTNLFRH